ncbi:histidine kinase dimerization/phosphoacceptor domain -containing protein [Sphingomonas sp. PsM26]|nr:histidine kinase dimerization/phosphoacceptor domain -containing protein [Sphingomonas sp. PsM26]
MTSVDDLLRRQHILAEFGDFSQCSDDLDEVLTRACDLVGEALGTDLAKVLEVEEEAGTLFVRAGVGWQPGVVGEVRLPMGERSSETYAINKGEPVACADINKEERFVFPEFMKDAGVVGIVNVPIFLHAHRPFGLLQVDSRSPWTPNDADIEFLRTYATILGPVIDRLHKVHALRLATDRNETLLRELQHRIKNNIGAIMSLVQMQIGRAKSDDARQELTIVADRIEALRLVHELVYVSRNTDQLALRPYATQLLEGLLPFYVDHPIRLETHIDEIQISSDLAIPLGLIINEFATNSLKHAWSGSDGAQAMIRIEARLRDGRFLMKIADNGRGLPDGESEGAQVGTGMGLIRGLTLQIGATPSWTSSSGTVLTLDFSIE